MVFTQMPEKFLSTLLAILALGDQFIHIQKVLAPNHPLRSWFYITSKGHQDLFSEQRDVLLNLHNRQTEMEEAICGNSQIFLLGIY